VIGLKCWVYFTRFGLGATLQQYIFGYCRQSMPETGAGVCLALGLPGAGVCLAHVLAGRCV